MSAPEIVRVGRAGVCAICGTAAALLAGCASPGPPRPPSLHLPEIIRDLSAQRVGDEVQLRWTTPAETTDGLNVAGVVTAQLCCLPQVGAKQAVCVAIRRMRVTPGASEIVDRLPEALTRDPEVALEYRIELFNQGERSAGLSSAAFAAGGAAPPLVTGLQGTATEAGALLRWAPADTGTEVELERLRTNSPGSTPAKAGPTEKRDEVMRLRVEAVGSGGPQALADPGGTVDPTAARGEQFVYTAQRVRRVVLDGHALELRSPVSAPVTVVMRDTFPPRAPVRVEAIAGKLPGGVTIDLSWTPNTEADLAGYVVSRLDLNDAANPGLLRLTPSPILSPAFRDTAVLPGHRYRYTVVAVDTAGNPSAPSEPADEDAPLP